MVRRRDITFRRGPVIRDLSVPGEERLLRPARLRTGRRRLGALVRRLYGTALLAWTIGLLAATSSLFQPQRANSNGAETRPDGNGGITVGLPDLPPPVRIEPRSAAGQP